MTWRTISECLPAELMFAIGIGEHTEATGSDALDLSPVAPQIGGGNPLRMTNKEGGVGAFTPAKLPPLWEVWTSNGVRKHGRAVTAATIGAPHPTARLFLVTVDGERVGHAALAKSS